MAPIAKLLKVVHNSYKLCEITYALNHILFIILKRNLIIRVHPFRKIITNMTGYISIADVSMWFDSFGQ